MRWLASALDELRLRLHQLGLGLRELRLGLRELSLGLIDGGLKRPRIDLEQQLALSDERAFGVILRQQIAGDLGLDGGVDHSVERADPFALDRDVFLLDDRDFDIGWRRRSARGVRITAARSDDGGRAE